MITMIAKSPSLLLRPNAMIDRLLYVPIRSHSTTSMIRLSKRMSELDMCSRREADKLIGAGKVLLNGNITQIGQKVDWKETDIEILLDESMTSFPEAIALHKPRGYVSGQPEGGHIPAIRLLSRETLVQGCKLDDAFFDSDFRDFAPAGRLDLESTGLLIFSRSGVIAKKLVSEMGKIDKEYIVTVEEAQAVSRIERQQGLLSLPSPSLNLKPLNRGGGQLLGDTRVLKPVKSKWILRGEMLNMVLKEGRKHQIRRMLREMIGQHVTSLHRVRIGPVLIEGIPPGEWRPLSQNEIQAILSA